MPGAARGPGVLPMFIPPLQLPVRSGADTRGRHAVQSGGNPVNRPAVACFVSPHGLGHASRAAAVLAALQQSKPDLAIHLYTIVDPGFFEDSGCRTLACHREHTDIGFVQKSALQEDLPETIRRLDAFLPFDPGLVARLAGNVREAGCKFVLCDIAPLGIRVAAAAGIPSVLVESFTWAWILY